VSCADRGTSGGHRHVDRFLDENPRIAFGGKLLRALLESLVDGAGQCVQTLAGLGPLGSGQTAECTPGERQRRRATGYLRSADDRQLIEIAGSSNRRDCLLTKHVEGGLGKVLRLVAVG
jgi:hypothetical protein